MKLRTGPLLAAVLALCVSSMPVAFAAQGRSISGQEVVDILQSEGYQAKLDVDEEGDPIVRTRMGGVNAFVLFYDCEGKRCGSLQFRVGLDLDKGSTLDVVNRFNRDFRYGNAFLDEENDPYLEFDFEVLHADHREHLISQVDVWEKVLGEFLVATGYRGDEAGDGDA